MPKATTIRAGIYCRISDDPSGQRAGVERQQTECTTLVNQLGWTIADAYIDNDISAFKRKHRPEYQRLLDDLRGGQLDAVVCWHPDRLHRSPAELETFIDIIEATGAKIATVTAGAYDLTTAAGRMSARIVGAVARHESEQKSERVRAKVRQLAAEGRPLGGRVGYGYATKLTLHPEQAEHLRDAARCLLAGQSLRSIVLQWNAAGRTTATGKPWTRQSLRHILRSPRIAGLQAHGGRTVEAAWPAIIDRATHERLVAFFAAPNRHGSVRRHDARLLSGLLTCGSCGATLWVVARRGTGGPRGYGCSACHRVSIDADGADAEVTRRLLDELADRPPLRPHGADEAPLVAELEAVSEQRRQWAYEAARGTISPDEWAAYRQGLDERARFAAQRLEQLRDVVDGGIDLADLAARWPTEMLGRQRQILMLAARSITVTVQAPSKRSRFDGDRIEIDWRGRA